MKLAAPLHAQHQLEQCAGPCEHGRQTRRYPGEPFPQARWDQAGAGAAPLPPTRVATQFRVRLRDLKKQRVAPPAAPARPRGCVAVPAAPARPQPAVATPLELARADGTRLCLHTPLAPLERDALVRACVAGRACCNGPRTAGACSPRTPWLAAQAWLDWPPWVGRCWGRTRGRGPSPWSATGRGRRSSGGATTARATGCV